MPRRPAASPIRLSRVQTRAVGDPCEGEQVDIDGADAPARPIVPLVKPAGDLTDDERMCEDLPRFQQP